MGTKNSGSTFDCYIVTLSQEQSVRASFTAPAVTTYEFDGNGNLRQITAPLGRIRQVRRMR